MATLQNPIDYARAQTQTDSNGLTDATAIIFANEVLVDFRRRLIDKGVDAAQTQESTRDATADQGTYLYPTDMFWLKAIEINLINTNSQDYRQASQMDVSNPSGASFSYIRKNADKNQPMFDDRGDQFEIFPTPTSGDNLTDAVRIFYYLEPTEYTSTSDTVAYPESLDYRILGWKIAENYLLSLGKLNEAEVFNRKYEERVKQIIETLSRGSQQPIKATTIQLTGFEF